MPRENKKSSEWARGRKLGCEAAREIIAKHGRALAEQNSEHLTRHARSRGADDFDKAYARAYRSVVFGNGLLCKR